MTGKVPITVAQGDGIGPEIMEATLHIVQEAGAQLEIATIEIGEKSCTGGHATSIPDEAWESLRQSRVLLKAPTTTPQGGGGKSMAMTLRKTLGLFANVRHAISYHPYVETRHPQLNLIVVRENEEGLYGGPEYRQSTDVVQGVSLTSRPGTERVIRYAFEYAQAHGRKKVSCLTKDNLLKLTDGFFHRTFDEIGVHYPEIAKEHWLVDIGAAKIADAPEAFDVVVLSTVYGDIISEIVAQIAGSVGMVASASIGADCAMFEAIHGSAPRLAGQNLANPSGLFLAGVKMLLHIGQPDAATRAHNAWLKTIEDGIHTSDIFKEGVSRQRVGTKEFAKAVVERLGQAPTKLQPVSYKNGAAPIAAADSYHRPLEPKQLVGVDLSIDFLQGTPDELAKILQPLELDGLKLEFIANRDVAVWPQGHAETFCTDTYVCRFKLPAEAKNVLQPGSVVALLDRVAKSGLEFLKMELLYTFDGKPGFSSVYGQ